MLIPPPSRLLLMVVVTIGGHMQCASGIFGTPSLFLRSNAPVGAAATDSTCSRLRGGGRHHKAKETASTQQDKVASQNICDSIARLRIYRSVPGGRVLLARNVVNRSQGDTEGKEAGAKSALSAQQQQGFLSIQRAAWHARPFLYAIAGRSTRFELALVQKFDITQGRWLPVPSLDAPRAAFATARAGGRIYVLGGSLDFEPLASVRSLAPYDALVDGHDGGEKDLQWRVESPLPFARRFCAAASWRSAVGEGKEAQEAVFVLGGAGRFHFADSAVNDLSFASVQSYDADHRTWVNHTDMPGGRRHHAAAVCHGRIYVFGGWRGCRDRQGVDAEVDEEKEQRPCREVLAEVASYDPLTGEWRQEPPMPTARRGLQAVCCGGRLYALGGVRAGQQLSTVESFDPQLRTWRPEPDMLQKRSCFGAATFNGCIYVAGGIVGGTDLKTVEIFDPNFCKWSSETSLPTRRWGHALVAL